MACITSYPPATLYGARGDGTTDDTAALTSWLSSISGKSGYLPAGTYMCSGLSIPASTTIYGYGATLKKNANGTLATLADRVRIYGLQVHGNGAAFTGKGFVITSGNDQKLYDTEIIFCEDRCLTIDKDVGLRFAWMGGQVFRSGDITNIPILLGANAASQESNGDRLFEGIFTGGRWFIDVQYSQTTIISNCDFVNMNFHASASKTLVSGCRIATLGNDLVVNGSQCMIDGNIIAGGITIASGATYNILGDNTLTNGSTITDNSGNFTNSYEKTGTYTPTWTSSGTQPSLGNGTLIGKWSIDKNGMVTVTINGTMGSTTTFGTGTYSWSLPFASASDGYIKVGSAYTNAGGASFSVGAAAVSSGASTVSVLPSSGGNSWGQTIPGTWASGNLFNLQVSYYR